jgi:hypothetical protein
MTESTRQTNRQRKREIEKVRKHVTHLLDTRPLNFKFYVQRHLAGCIDPSKSQDRKNLESNALALCIVRGNAEHAIEYFDIIENLPDVILAYDSNKLFHYVFQSCYTLLAKDVQ